VSFRLDIRWHGRGGHGLVSTSILLCSIAVRRGLYALSIPIFGAERRGAPTRVYTRISNKPIRRRSGIKKPDIVVITDKSLLTIVNPLHGLKDNGIVIINAERLSENEYKMVSKYKVYTINAVELAIKADLKVGGIPVVTIPMLGALLKVIKIIPPDIAFDVIKERWHGELAEKNINALKLGLEVIKE